MMVEDARELMCPEIGKWGKIAMVLNSGKGEGDVQRDRDACKYKWSTLLADFKKIWDFHSRTGTNSEEYFRETTPAEKKLHKLPKTFYFIAYKNMAVWLRDKATLTSPHARDTMDRNDHNYHAPIPEDSGHFQSSQPLPSFDTQDSWAPLRGGIGAPINLHSGESPAVSSGRTQRSLGSQGIPAGVHIPPPNTSSFADVSRLKTP